MRQPAVPLKQSAGWHLTLLNSELKAESHQTYEWLNEADPELTGRAFGSRRKRVPFSSRGSGYLQPPSFALKKWTPLDCMWIAGPPLGSGTGEAPHPNPVVAPLVHVLA